MTCDLTVFFVWLRFCNRGFALKITGGHACNAGGALHRGIVAMFSVRKNIWGKGAGKRAGNEMKQIMKVVGIAAL